MGRRRGVAAVRWWRIVLLVAAGFIAAVAGTVLAVSVNVATGGTAPGFPALEQRPWLWSAGATVGVAGAGLLAWWAQRQYELGLAALVPAAQRPESWVVGRPAEVDRIVRAVRRRGRTATVGITTAVHGAGGFGKTTVARLVRADRRVLRRFGGRVYWVTLGRDVRRGALVEKVNDLVRQVDAGRAEPFTDVRQAAEHLAAVLAAGPARLVVLDDVWFEDQLTAFPVAGRCSRLVTTRVPSLVASDGMPVKVDQMSVDQAQGVLTADLPHLPPAVVTGLIMETGRWPLLLRLVNKILLDQSRLRTDVTAVAEDLLQRLRRDGALQVDMLTGAADRHLDINDPDQRDEAVAATIEASTGLLGGVERERFAELAIFAEDETVPVAVINALWRATGGLDGVATPALCARLADLALLTLTATDDGGTISMHDVVRDYLHDELGSSRVMELHRTLLDTVALELPIAEPPSPEQGRTDVVAWWQMPGSAPYLWDHLIEHLLAAGRGIDAEVLASDLRWVGARLQMSGPAAPFADLALIDSSRAGRLRRLLGQVTHLLTPTEPVHACIDILYSRIAHDPEWGGQARILARERPVPGLINRWALPDLPDPALRRTLTGRTGQMQAVAIGPDGRWLASGGADGSVRIWDAATGEQRTVLTGHTGWVWAVAIAPDGTWLAATSADGSLRVWDSVTGEQRMRLTGHAGGVLSVAIARDGTWLATVSEDGSVRVWDAATGAQRVKLTGRVGGVLSVAITPDSGCLATAGADGSVRLWDAISGQERMKLTGHTDWVRAVAIAPDGTWLASTGDDRSVRIWDAFTGEPRMTLTGHTQGWVWAVAIAPDGTWLATSGDDRSVRIWDVATGEQRRKLTGHTGKVLSLAIAPDGTWLATTGTDGTVRIWDVNTDEQPIGPTGHTGKVLSLAVAPDGTWVATSGDDRSVRMWDAVNGELRRELIGHTGQVHAVAVAPDGTWLASAGADGWVRLWDAATGGQRTVLTAPADGRLWALAIAPDGTWLAATGADGSIRIWNVVTGEQRMKLAGHTQQAQTVVIAPDGTWLATAGFDASVRVWDAVTGEQRMKLTHPDWVWAVAVAPDGTWLASASDDGSVRIWDAVTGEQRRELTGHTGQVHAVAVAPDGAWLASAGDDGSVRVWNATTGHAAGMTRPEQAVHACAWSPAGPILLVGGAAGLYQFDFRPQTPLSADDRQNSA